MKRPLLRLLSLLLLCCTLLLGGLIAFLQSSWGRTLVLSYVQESVREETGYVMEIARSEAHFPFYLELQDLRVFPPGDDKNSLSIEKVQLWWAPWQLLFDRLRIKRLCIEQISVEGTPSFNLEGRGWIRLSDLSHYRLLELQLSGAGYHFDGQLLGEGHNQAHEGKFSLIQSGHLELPPVKGQFHWTPKAGLQGELRAQTLIVDEFSIQDLLLTVEGFPKLEGSYGDFTFDAKVDGKQLSLHSPFSYHPDEGLKLYQIDGQWSDKQALQGDLHLLHPSGQVFGNLQAWIRGGGREIRTELALGTCPEGGQAFDLELSGSQELKLTGSYLDTGKRAYLVLDTLEGELDQRQITLESPIRLVLSDQGLLLTPFTLRYGDGSLRVLAEQGANDAIARLELEHFPLDGLSLLFPASPITGYANGTLSYEGDGYTPLVQLELELEDVAQLGESWMHLPRLSGTLKGSMGPELLELNASLHDRGGQNAQLELALPIDFSLAPLRWKLRDEVLCEGKLRADGRLLPFVHVFIPDASQIDGDIKLDIALGGSPSAPYFAGAAKIRDGVYESLHLGSRFEKVDAELSINGRTVFLDRLSATDGKKGAFHARGQIVLDPKQQLPYTVEADIENCRVLQMDYSRAAATGKLSLEGTFQGAHLEGKLRVVDGLIEIPDDIPVSVDSIDVRYVNGPLSAPRKKPPKKRFPFTWDLRVSSHGDVQLRGRGLQSQWQGEVHVGGSVRQPIVKGPLKVKRGDFSFAGKQFRIQDGLLQFNGHPIHDTQLGIRALLDLGDTDIYAELKGALKSPRLELKSSPSMEQSELLSRILFNKGVQHISGVQAVTLANAAAALSGNHQLDILGRIRDGIGVDYFDIRTDDGPLGADDEDDAADSHNLAIKIGKQLSQRVFITLTQGMRSGNTKVGFEAQFGRGFSLEAAVDTHADGELQVQWKKDY